MPDRSFSTEVEECPTRASPTDEVSSLLSMKLRVFVSQGFLSLRVFAHSEKVVLPKHGYF